MYETEYNILLIVWMIAIFAYLEWCRRNREKWLIDPIDALMFWLGIGFGATAWFTWVNEYVQATLGNIGLSVMFLIVVPIMLRVFSQSSTPLKSCSDTPTEEK